MQITHNSYNITLVCDPKYCVFIKPQYPENNQKVYA